MWGYEVCTLRTKYSISNGVSSIILITYQWIDDASHQSEPQLYMPADTVQSMLYKFNTSTDMTCINCQMIQQSRNQSSDASVRFLRVKNLPKLGTVIEREVKVTPHSCALNPLIWALIIENSAISIHAVSDIL
ncbi:hypothetical protein VNO77_35340 [Canavalia gladiata]|uniref:Uncharacterized protein n=1 Tax=Canavalia gladiata TaxID=3824 RepID=A0AAN9KIH1_CANGL